MTLTELRYIVTLAREKHFGRAAERCHVSQPTLSVAVKKLEEELGVPLFERSKSSIRVTETGQRIIEQAQRVLAVVQKAVQCLGSGAAVATTQSIDEIEDDCVLGVGDEQVYVRLSDGALFPSIRD